MSIFNLIERLIDDYSHYVQSFLTFSDERLQGFVEKELIQKGVLWPEALLQLNPNYGVGDAVEALCSSGKLHPLCAEIFPFHLYRHQQEAIERALRREHFVVTSGTGSGKTLTYFIPIFDAVLRGNPQEHKVRAIIVYPMNALVNSQLEELNRLSQSFKEDRGRDFPIRFARYTGQESREEKWNIQNEPPHILLTNYVMLELMLVRPQERRFVDRTATGLEFLILDELHTYRGRQGADVALLVRRLRERCGNPNLLCIGTSATMVAGRKTTAEERRQAVAEFASRIFGVEVKQENIIEERLQRITSGRITPNPEELRQALGKTPPETLEEMLKNPLTAWIEHEFGIEIEPDGNLRRRTPISLKEGAFKLAEVTGEDENRCEEYLRGMFLNGSKSKLPDKNSLFAFKLHQFIAQGRTVYATIESPSDRLLTLEAQYYAPGEGENRILYPLWFCRVCGQDYYAVMKDDRNSRLIPWEPGSEALAEGDWKIAYLAISQDEIDVEWDSEGIPPEWLDNRGKVKRGYRDCIPQPIWVRSDGAFSEERDENGVKAWLQPKPFMLCTNCGEFYTRRHKNDFRKLARLSSEGRSTATTVLSVSTLLHASEGEIKESARKVLSFTDNRQDASLQAGHFNDFVQVSLLRAAIYAALSRCEELRYYEISDKVVEGLRAVGLTLRDIARNPDLDESSSQGRRVWDTFRNLIEYRIYKDLERGWRVIQPNLEQCGLLKIEYEGLNALCFDDAKWQNIKQFSALSPDERKEILRTILDHFRKKLAIKAKLLEETQGQQLRRRIDAEINEQWAGEDIERTIVASRFLLPNSSKHTVEGGSLSERSLVGKYLKRRLDLSVEDYIRCIQEIVDILCSHGFLIKAQERGVDFVQLESSCLIWGKGDGTPTPPDPIYSRRVESPLYIEAQRRTNKFFTAFYQNVALHLRGVEGREHTAQVSYDARQKREDLFRNGELSCLFCSPTMELGIDIADLQIVHMRNVPPTPANYAQRSGRSGRRGDPALALTYCAAGSAHDQYFFRNRDQMVAGAVRAPRLDLGNDALIKAHVNAIWLAKVGLSLKDSVTNILELELEEYPLKEEIKVQLQLSESRRRECIKEAQKILETCAPDLTEAGWYSDEWLEETIRKVPEEFDGAFDRWRELYHAAIQQLQEAQTVFFRSLKREEQEKAKRNVDEANRQRNLLCNIEVSREESDFYPYRYLASEGFLPGYNFPRLPIRAFIPHNDGEFIARPRFLALTEFGPYNVIYHEGAKYQVRALISPPGGLHQRRTSAKLCGICGYFNEGSSDVCGNCSLRSPKTSSYGRTQLDASTSEVVPLLQMPSVKTIRRERITCDEENRIRFGYDITTHFQFASVSGERRLRKATAYDTGNNPLLHLVYGPTASLMRINHGWRNSKEKGLLVDLATGGLLSKPREEEAAQGPPIADGQPERIRFYVHDTVNMLLIHPGEMITDESDMATLQYALQRGMEQVFQVEESELASERIGSEEHRSILFWEAAEGGLGVLRRLVQERDMLAFVAYDALERCHFDPESIEDKNPDCSHACYECLLSYSNQRHHSHLNRHQVKGFLAQLAQCEVQADSGRRSYEEHYRWLRSLTDSRSELERKFIDHLYQTKRRMPDEAQKPLQDYHSIPDFFCESNVCLFCDGSVHDEPEQQRKDRITRQELRDFGYRVIVIRYDKDLEEQISQYPDVFGEG